LLDLERRVGCQEQMNPTLAVEPSAGGLVQACSQLDG
jgi:hypothetical protein